MPTRQQLLAVTQELQRIKAEGVRGVTVSDEAMEELRRAIEASLAKSEAVAVAGEPAASPNVQKPITRQTSPAATGARPAPPKADQSIPQAAPVVRLPEGDKAARWAALYAAVQADPVCAAHVHPGKKIVLGVGDLEAKIFFCGEAPGAEEETQGEPFVGPAGQLLTRMIQAMGLKREQVYIGNIMNWRPQMPVGPAGIQIGNRPPTAQEMNYCLPYLRAQIEVVQPELIVALGATAAGGLLGVGTFRTLGEIKGRWHEFAGKPVMVTYHPSYILRNNSNRSKRGIWEDLLKVMERAGLDVSEKQRNFFR